MTLRSIAARFECDGCGRNIADTIIDPALEINGGTLFDAAELQLRDDLHTSVQHGLHLCGACTRIADQIPDPADPDDERLADNYAPTRDEILEAIKEQM